jgi:GT2 family glycosyltransferase/serine acetyltransferase
VKIAAVFVNYRTAEMTIQAVRALLAELEPLGPHRVYVVDNDSQDGSYERLSAAAEAHGWGARVAVLAAPLNGGYGYGINFAVRHALSTATPPDYVYVINTDATPEPGSLARLLAFMEARPEVGLAGSRVRGPDGVTQGAAFRFPSILSELEERAAFSVVSRLLREHIVAMPVPAADELVDWLPGTSMFIRRAVFEDGLYFDEGFFLYFEEVDFARRLRDAGWRASFVADAPISHVGSVSTGLGERTRRLPDYWFDSRHRYFLKHHSAAYTAAADAAFVLGYLIYLAKRAALRQPEPLRSHLLRDFLRASARELLRGGRVARRAVGAPSADDEAPSALALFELLAEDFETSGGDPLDPGFWAVAAHRLQARARGAKPGPIRRALELGADALALGVDWVWRIKLPASVELGRRVRLHHGGGGMLLNARAIGADVSIKHDTTLGPLRAQQGGAEEAPDALPTIEAGAALGSGVAVLGPVVVGRGARILSNSVVLRDVAPGATVVGVPSRAAVE